MINWELVGVGVRAFGASLVPLKVRQWWASRQAKKAAAVHAAEKAIFERWLRDPKTGGPQLLDTMAVMRAHQMIRDELEKNRITHCQFCNRVRSLRRNKNGPGYVCPEHWEKLQKAQQPQVAGG